MQGALRSSLVTLRSSVCRHLKLRAELVNSAGGVSYCTSRDVHSPLGVLGGFRGFSADTHGPYLDKADVTNRILTIVTRQQKVDPTKVSPTSHLQNDLGLDSLDTVEVVMAIEEEFAIEIPDAEADKIVTVPDAVEYIASHPKAK